MSAGAGKTIPNGDYVIVSKMSDDLYLDIPGIDTPSASGKVVTICNGHPGKGNDYDAWTITYLNNGYYKITQKDTNTALDLYEDSLNRGTRVSVNNYTGADSQQWSINKTDCGYQIQSKSTCWVLDVAGGKTTPGTPVNIWENNGNSAQLWSFSPFASDSKTESASKYPVVSYEVSGRQFRLKWNAVNGMEKYGIAVYQSGKWKLKVQTTATTYTSPKISRGIYKMAVVAKKGGKWDTTNIKNRAFALTIR